MSDRLSHPALGRAVRALRDEMGLTAEALAERSGLGVARIGQIEADGVAVRLSDLHCLASGLGIPASELVRRAEELG